jgi:hypothetical protein
LIFGGHDDVKIGVGKGTVPLFLLECNAKCEFFRQIGFFCASNRKNIDVFQASVIFSLADGKINLIFYYKPSPHQVLIILTVFAAVLLCFEPSDRIKKLLYPFQFLRGDAPTGRCGLSMHRCHWGENVDLVKRLVPADAHAVVVA